MTSHSKKECRHCCNAQHSHARCSSGREHTRLFLTLPCSGAYKCNPLRFFESRVRDGLARGVFGPWGLTTNGGIPMRATARLGLVVFSVLLVAASLAAQSTSLSGVIKDPQSAVVPNASITLASAATGVARETKSDSQGRYNFLQVTPGTYMLTVKAPGFAEEVISNVELLVNQPATIPVTLRVGATSTTVTVEANAVQLNTTDASLGNVVDQTQITELPTYARNIVALLANQPGVTIFGSAGQGANGTNNLDYRSGSVNGGKSDQGSVTLDGVNVDDQNTRAAFTSVLRVTPDSVEEFRSTTTNQDASGGRGSGASVAMVTKAGSNEFHGTLYDHRRAVDQRVRSVGRRPDQEEQAFLLHELRRTPRSQRVVGGTHRSSAHHAGGNAELSR